MFEASIELTRSIMISQHTGFIVPIFIKLVLAERRYVWTFNTECHLYGGEMRGIRVGILFRPLVVFFFPPMPPHVLMNFRGFPPDCGDSVADF